MNSSLRAFCSWIANGEGRNLLRGAFVIVEAVVAVQADSVSPNVLLFEFQRVDQTGLSKRRMVTDMVLLEDDWHLLCISLLRKPVQAQ